MRRERTAVHAQLLRPRRAFRRRAFLSVRRRVGLGLFDVFEREQQLIFRQALGAPSEAMALELLDDLAQTLVLSPLGQPKAWSIVCCTGE